MRASRPLPDLLCPTQAELDWFLKSGVEIKVLASPEPMRLTQGRLAHDGVFEPDAYGDRWFAFEVPTSNDIVFWNWSSGRLCTWSGRAFALGQDVIDEAAIYGFDGNLNIYADPLHWLQAKRDGIVVLPDKWPLAFDHLREVPRIAIAEELLPHYRRHMKPARMPELMIIPDRRRAA